MLQLEPLDRVALELEDRWSEVEAVATRLLDGDPEFSTVEPPPKAFAVALASALRSSQSMSLGIHPEWNQAAIELAASCNSIGVFSSRVRYTAVAAEQVLVQPMDPVERLVPIARLFCATYLALEAVARRTAAQISHETLHSHTTGLRNKRAFEGDLASALETGVRPIHVAYLDMDGLKRINDEEGHGAGDAALRSLAEVLARAVREGQAAYHFSGDEFGLIQRGGTAADLAAQLEQVRAEAPNKFSFGVAVSPADGEQGPDLVALADARMQEQKRARRAEGAEIRA